MGRSTYSLVGSGLARFGVLGVESDVREWVVEPTCGMSQVPWILCQAVQQARLRMPLLIMF